MTAHIALVRHGETEWNRQQRIQGTTDIPLNARGREQALATGHLLAGLSPGAVFASPLARAFETATIMGELLGLPAPIAVPGLVERNYGHAEGLSFREKESRFPHHAAIPGQESKDELARRSVAALHSIATSHPESLTIVVAHGGVIRAVFDHIDSDATQGEIRNGSIHTLEFSGDTLSLLEFDGVAPSQSSPQSQR